MKARIAATIFCLLIVCGSLKAESFAIRTESKINLRLEPSIDSSVIRTVRPGTILQVTGQFNRWFRISYGGAEAWMADWVNYSHLESGNQTATPLSGTNDRSEIDNCCFVDRQCNNDEDWKQGYWAFQNGQCIAPPSTNSNATAPAERSAQQADVDNCCFVDRQCTTDEDWKNGYRAFQNSQCRSPEVSDVSASSSAGDAAVMAGVIDGDTIDVLINGRRARLRYIGIDTPERGEACYREATDYNRSLVQGKALTLVRDTSDYGPFGRLLRYIYADGVFVNLAMVQAGYAKASYYAPNGRHRHEFENAERSAARPICTARQARESGSHQQINNCCFVDRQCSTDQEWTDGYFAYQNRQCVTVRGSKPSASTPVNYLRNCTHARSIGITRIPIGHPLYRPPLDGDNDGIACERTS